MVVLNKIYTKTGDDGTTALGSGERRRKSDLRIEAYGTVDETNSVVGLIRLQTGQSAPEVDQSLGRIQNDLFDLGADLATPETGEDLGYEPLRITDAQVTAIEQAIDVLNAELKPLRSFVLPGGSPAAAYLHLARTVSRRAERLMVELAAREQINPAAVRYMNRLSDYFFVASRYLNEKGEQDVLWVPGQNR
ncbi:ATP:cob(I)alamin adenosyltransferase [Roseibium algicola]|jgi:cob(I)alamin adenosyltransferase|uniref:Corrinoid adenosyltransferase n=1 Tax=Roseibium algicola TaxID=2857014 RepID=A0ABN4WRH1_9HYPH|nr:MULTISPECIES: cob(I)yrinic acid a,c-diamide adenosyltransferase [Stappiaceae]MCR9283751.1 cob(I)yrinic acid a,c-diamide adenosyltransferase [Paracoccaceae bacterium]MEC9403023.1 cob(I)yrinic acid a,c-diamide adenosyltransferase [Pseudomonadota bacterium]AQQ04324.1 ATP:cob(I)alamin adenosyltransferase [Roseibium aggregatum]ERP87412.1 cob(I)yrinic acid a,c-diamide adenosyltransferase [Labrenzia sp. C1B10]ERS07716.1 cob(I)yrinic acid a,c-diamide adenosyltransferase [Labrenzia sp. C1B70]